MVDKRSFSRTGDGTRIAGRPRLDGANEPAGSFNYLSEDIPQKVDRCFMALSTVDAAAGIGYGTC